MNEEKGLSHLSNMCLLLGCKKEEEGRRQGEEVIVDLILLSRELKCPYKNTEPLVCLQLGSNQSEVYPMAFSCETRNCNDIFSNR